MKTTLTLAATLTGLLLAACSTTNPGAKPAHPDCACCADEKPSAHPRAKP